MSLICIFFPKKTFQCLNLAVSKGMLHMFVATTDIFMLRNSILILLITAFGEVPDLDFNFFFSFNFLI